MNGNMEIIKQFGKCCYCGGSMFSSEFVNMINLNKKAEWEFPNWDNILLKEEFEHIKRASSFLCDNCIEKNNNPIFAYSMNDNKIFYHDISRLEDVFPITEEMLKI